MERLEGTRVHLEYNTELFGAGTIRQILSHYLTLLRAVMERPAARLSEVSLLSSPEKHLVEFESNGKAPVSPHHTVLDLLRRQVEGSPGDIAAVCGGIAWTYRELDERANRIADGLRMLGVMSGDRVGLCLERSHDMLASILGIWKAGGACIPLDPADPEEWRALLLEEAEAGILLEGTNARRSPNAARPRRSVRVVSLDEIARTARPVEQPSTDWAQGEGTAYLLFTGAHEGKPKCVGIGHRALVNVLEALAAKPGFHSGETLLSISPNTSGWAAIELWLPLVCGGRVVIAAEAQVNDAHQLRLLLEEVAPAVFEAPASIWRQLVESGWNGDGSLRMWCAGAGLSRRLADDLLRRGGALWRLDGMAETAVCCAVLEVHPGEDLAPIGEPIANTRFYVLGPDLEPVPAGVPGELFIAGKCLPAGYPNLPEHTLEKFVKPRFDHSFAASMYRTGSVARWLPGGAFQILDRKDREVDLRGFHVNPEQLEKALQTSAEVRNAVAITKADAEGDCSLIAYVVPSNTGDRASLKTRLRALLRAKLPGYLQPSDIVVLDRFPLTAKGGVNYAALSQPNGLPDLTCPDYLAPRDSVEAQLVEIWERVLGRSPIGIKTSFFDLGGYSLMVVKLFAQINRTFGCALPIALIFSAPTVEMLARAVRGQIVSTALAPIQPSGEREPLFVVHSYLIYGGLRQILGQERPLYGLQEASDENECVYGIGDRVRQYVKAIRSVQPHGPYHLIGWCAAGPLTLEVARELKSEGDQVALLALIDSSRPGYSRELRKTIPLMARWKAKFQFHRKRLAGLTPAQTIPYLRRLGGRSIRISWGRILLRYWKVVYRMCQRYGIAPPAFMHNISWMTFASMQVHKLQPYDGDITLFRASDIAAPEEDPTLGWGEIALREIDVIWVPGDHESMFREPNLSVFGAALRNAFEAKQRVRLSAGRGDAIACNTQLVQS
ncbi:MAG: AMP-binding protein [Acidobacteriia bacterium]|nr:AMP-binding protein [Terriglobia bacterium]